MLDKHSLTTSTITYNFNKFLLKSVEHKKKKRYLYFNRRTSTQSGFQLRTVVKSYFKYLYLWRFIRTFNKKSGHNNLGTFTVHSKGRCKKYKKILYLKNLNLFKYFIYLVWYCVSVKTKTHYYLSLNSAGQLSYIPATNRMRLLSLMCGFGLKTFCKVSDIYIKNIWMICNRIRDIHRLSTVCFVAKNQYEPATIALAAGTACRLVSRRKLNNLMKVRLKMPSGKLKCISVAVVVFLGHIIPRKKVLLKNTRAGYWRNLGKKPQVRGIVKNSVDHPNGGRCRTLFRPRTPWGKYAK